MRHPFRFHKYHALGNDYIVLDPANLNEVLNPRQIQRICHRHYGIGSDGILLGPMDAEDADCTLRIFNPDGSEAEKSGNGLRIFARYLWDKDKIQKKTVTIRTLGGLVRARVGSEGKTVSVEMGRVSFDSGKVPVEGPARQVLEETMVLNNDTFVFSAATIGNPHCVIICPQISAAETRKWGPLIENEPRFPNRTNVQFVQILDRNNIRIEIWERGAGYTLASGSSSSASAAVVHRLGLCDGDITVHMPGGRIAISVSETFDVLMTGSVTRVARGTLDPEMFE